MHQKGFLQEKTYGLFFRKRLQHEKRQRLVKTLLRSSVGKALMQAGKEKIESLLKGLSELSAETESVRQRPMPWIGKGCL